MGFGAMRITGKGIWGEPADRAEAIRVLRRAVELYPRRPPEKLAGAGSMALMGAIRWPKCMRTASSPTNRLNGCRKPTPCKMQDCLTSSLLDVAPMLLIQPVQFRRPL